MRRFILFSLAMIALLYTGYITIAIMANYENVYHKIRKKMALEGYKIKASHINIERFPFPKVEVHDFTIDNKLAAKVLEIKFSPLSTLSLTPKVKVINIHDVKIYTSDNRLDFTTHHPLISKMLKLLPKLPKIEISNLKVIDDVTKDIQYVENVSVDSSSPSNQMIVNWGNDSITKVSYNNVDNATNVQINYTGPVYSMKLSEIYKKNNFQEATMRYNVKEFGRFLENRYGEVDLLATRVVSQEPVDFFCKIKRDDDRIRFSNIKMTSKSMDMKGNMDFYQSEKPDEINLIFNHINLTALLEKPDMTNIRASKNKRKLLLDDVTRILNVRAKNINLLDTNIQDFTLEAEINKSGMRIDQISGGIGGKKGRFEAKGNITQNQYRSFFDGRVHFDHEDLNQILKETGFKKYASAKKTSIMLTSDVKATPIDYKLNNLFMKIEDINISGDGSIKLIGSKPRVNLSLSLSSLNLFDKNIPILNNTIRYFTTLTQDMKSKTYLQKYIPLREVEYLGNIDLSFNNVQIGSNEIDKLRVNTSISPGNIVLNSLYYQDGESYLAASGFLSAAGIKPRIAFKVGESYLVTDKFNLDNILASMQNLYNNCDLDKIKVHADFTAQTIKQKDLEFKDVHIAAKNKGILWNIESLKGKYAGGAFDASGSLRLDAMNLNLAYAYNDFNIKQFNKLIPLNAFGIADGQMSFNGVISTNGSNWPELYYNLYSKSVFLAKNIIWKNFNIDGFIDHVISADYDAKNLDRDSQYFMQKGNVQMLSLGGEMNLSKGLFKLSEVDFMTAKTKGRSDVQYNMYDTSINNNTNFIFKPKVSSMYYTGSNVSIPVKITGKISSPKSKIGLKELKNYLQQNSRNRYWNERENLAPQIE